MPSAVFHDSKGWAPLSDQVEALAVSDPPTERVIRVGTFAKASAKPIEPGAS